MSTAKVDDMENGDILVVDDSAESLWMLANLLTGAGYHVRTANNGNWALRSVQIKPPELILLDIRMPDLDGYQVCQQLKANEKTRAIPVILISASDEEADKVNGFQCGAVDYINKPFHMDEILARVRTHLALHKTKLALEQANYQLQAAHDVLEVKVKTRTAELEQTNQKLQQQIAENQSMLRTLSINQERYRMLFEDSPISLWEEDFSGVQKFFGELSTAGITDWKSYFDSHPEAITRCVALVKVVDVNKATLTLFGAKDKDELCAGLNNVFAGEAQDVFREELIALASGEKQFSGASTHRTLAGEIINICLNLNVAPGSERTLDRVLLSILDITERRRSEVELIRHREHLEELVKERTAELEESEAHIRALIDNLPFEIWAMDSSLRYTIQNMISIQNYGNVVGKRIEDLGLPPQIVSLWMEQNQKVMAGKTLRDEYDREVAGERRIYENLVAPVMLAHNAIGIVGMGLDITDRKRNEEKINNLNIELEQRVRERTAQLETINRELRESEQRYHLVFESSPVSIWEEDFSQVQAYFNELRAQGITNFRTYFESHPEAVAYCATLIKVLDVNQATLSLLEAGDKQSVLEGLPKILGDSQLKVLREEMITMAEGGQGFHSNEELHRTLRGNQKIVSIRTSVAPGYEHSLSRVLVSMVDITDLKRAENEIRELNQDLEKRVADRTIALERVNKELEAFAYSISHDLRAPLRHIDGFLEFLRERTSGSLDEKSQHYMSIIAESAKRMGILIDDLLSFSRMGRSEMTKTQINLEELVRDVIAEFQPEVEGRDIQWQMAPLPWITGDCALLRVVLVNLISNAVKFTRPRAQAKIEIGSMQEQGEELVVYIRDNGVGFDMHYADQLFGVFHRLHREEEFEGTGIGLANVRRIIIRHGGRTWAEGEVDRGATFYFSLPQPEQEEFRHPDEHRRSEEYRRISSS